MPWHRFGSFVNKPFSTMQLSANLQATSIFSCSSGRKYSWIVRKEMTKPGAPWQNCTRWLWPLSTDEGQLPSLVCSLRHRSRLARIVGSEALDGSLITIWVMMPMRPWMAPKSFDQPSRRCNTHMDGRATFRATNLCSIYGEIVMAENLQQIR